MPRWFSAVEVSGLAPKLVHMLDEAREAAGVPFVITSGFRTPEQNEDVGGAKNSAHLRGLAVDLSARYSRERFLIVKALIDSGFDRIVVYAGDGHVHADIDDSLPSPVLVVLK